jgi:hypothetical protein
MNSLRSAWTAVLTGLPDPMIRAKASLTRSLPTQRAISRETILTQNRGHYQENRFPENTIVQFNYVPTVRAQLELSRKDASKAIEALQAAAPYELGSPGGGAFSPALYPVYVRGQAYLAAHQGGAAAVEFQRIPRSSRCRV